MALAVGALAYLGAASVRRRQLRRCCPMPVPAVTAPTAAAPARACRAWPVSRRTAIVDAMKKFKSGERPASSWAAWPRATAMPRSTPWASSSPSRSSMPRTRRLTPPKVAKGASLQEANCSALPPRGRQGRQGRHAGHGQPVADLSADPDGGLSDPASARCRKRWKRRSSRCPRKTWTPCCTSTPALNKGGMTHDSGSQKFPQAARRRRRRRNLAGLAGALRSHPAASEIMPRRAYAQAWW